MRTLYLLRHAEAASSTGEDIRRPLTQAGRIEAEAVGRWFSKHELKPVLVLHSPARRVRETLAALEHSMPGLECKALEEIYNAPSLLLLETLRLALPEKKSLLLIGHNPGIQELAFALTGEAEPAVQQAMVRGFSPATLAVLDCPLDSWADLKPGLCRMTGFYSPGSL